MNNSDSVQCVSSYGVCLLIGLTEGLGQAAHAQKHGDRQYTNKCILANLLSFFYLWLTLLL